MSLSPIVAVHVAFTNDWVSGARINKRYKGRVIATGGTDTYRWVRRGKLPFGMKGKPTKTGDASVIKGRPTKTGLFTFTLTATDAGGASSTKRYKVRVRGR